MINIKENIKLPLFVFDKNFFLKISREWELLELNVNLVLSTCITKVQNLMYYVNNNQLVNIMWEKFPFITGATITTTNAWKSQ